MSSRHLVVKNVHEAKGLKNFKEGKVQLTPEQESKIGLFKQRLRKISYADLANDYDARTALEEAKYDIERALENIVLGVYKPWAKTVKGEESKDNDKKNNTKTSSKGRNGKPFVAATVNKGKRTGKRYNQRDGETVVTITTKYAMKPVAKKEQKPEANNDAAVVSPIPMLENAAHIEEIAGKSNIDEVAAEDVKVMVVEESEQAVEEPAKEEEHMEEVNNEEPVEESVQEDEDASDELKQSVDINETEDDEDAYAVNEDEIDPAILEEADAVLNVQSSVQPKIDVPEVVKTEVHQEQQSDFDDSEDEKVYVDEKEKPEQKQVEEVASNATAPVVDAAASNNQQAQFPQMPMVDPGFLAFAWNMYHFMQPMQSMPPGQMPPMNMPPGQMPPMGMPPMGMPMPMQGIPQMQPSMGQMPMQGIPQMPMPQMPMVPFPQYNPVPGNEKGAPQMPYFYPSYYPPMPQPPQSFK